MNHQGSDCPVTAYILRSWDGLTRSLNEYASLVDIKIKSNPILYLPADFMIPADVIELYDRSHVQVLPLPQVIAKMGDIRPKDLTAPGLLYLPNPYVVPGGRFNEMYGWDSYFIILGLISSGRYGLARGMVENFLFEIKKYGGVLNANRTYCLTRSQPPFLTAMIRAVYDTWRCFDGAETRTCWLEDAYKLASEHYSMWLETHHRAGNTGLTRYFDLDTGPVPELADDSTYYYDVIEWLLKHPQPSPGYLVDDYGNSDRTANSLVALSGPRPGTDALNVPTCIKGHCLSEDFYVGDRAMRESGFDSSFRFGPFCGLAHHFAPVCLNSLLFRYECDMAAIAVDLRRTGDAQVWEILAE